MSFDGALYTYVIAFGLQLHWQQSKLDLLKSFYYSSCLSQRLNYSLFRRVMPQKFQIQLLCKFGFSCVGSIAFSRIRNLRIQISKVYLCSSFLIYDFGTSWSNEIELCNNILRNISSNIQTTNLPKGFFFEFNLFCNLSTLQPIKEF